MAAPLFEKLLAQEPLNPQRLARFQRTVGASSFSWDEWMEAFEHLGTYARDAGISLRIDHLWEYVHCAAESPEALVAGSRLKDILEVLLEREGYDGP